MARQTLNHHQDKQTTSKLKISTVTVVGAGGLGIAKCLVKRRKNEDCKRAAHRAAGGGGASSQ
jgi:hypothetical protein